MSRWPCLLFCAVLVSCASPQDVPLPDIAKITKTWPSGPQQKAKIRYFQEFGGPEDLGIRPSAFRRFMDAITGTKDTGLMRPYAISVYRKVMLVGDPGKHGLHLFDHENRSYRFISAVDGESLSSPVGVALGEDRLFAADSALGKVFILDYEGNLRTSITDLQRPTGLAFDTEARRLYVADTLAHRIVVFDQNGKQLFEFGKRGSGDSEFNFPSHIFLSGGKLLINDNMNFRIQIFDVDGHFLSSFGKHGDGSGYLSQPKGVAADSRGNIYVAGATIDRVQIFSPKGEFLLAFGSKGSDPGEFLMPAGVTVVDDRIYVADSYNQRIQVFQYVGGD